MNYYLYAIKARLLELVRFDYPQLKLPLSMYLLFLAWSQFRIGKPLLALQCLAKLQRSAWLGSTGPVVKLVRKYVYERPDSGNRRLQLIDELSETVSQSEKTERFFNNPLALFDGVCRILKFPTGAGKGVIIVKYNYCFPLMFKLFDMKSLAEHYHIVLEPSWAGTCDPAIIAYSVLDVPVFVMAYEDRDRDFLNLINTTLNPICLSSNWWVDHRVFYADPSVTKDIDVVVIAAWARFKRHHKIFKALRSVRKYRGNIKIALVGYPGDLTIDQIKKLATHFGLNDVIEYHEKIPQCKVSAILRRSKVNLLWSRFEGINRGIIEGMFCDVPCVIREGFNYGQKYAYINPKTGVWASESNLPEVLVDVIEKYNEFEPRAYVMEHHNCFLATKKLQELINASLRNLGKPGIHGIAVKVNELNCMKYFDEADTTRFASSIKNLIEFVR
ncbi:Glycosyl transferases group 1 [Thiorhodovibrio winogradskyi]|uniref:Glycosyl transferases group 1 n=1 Tax=Thiorhodovibrio winogradskyi TaxID=77007 RepID=A0ABZ0SB52_9GAMM|nr:glycosyltransferase [Thiorhodovibrio winogradskyi]